MKKTISLFLFLGFAFCCAAQNKFGNVWNIGYYGNSRAPVTRFNANNTITNYLTGTNSSSHLCAFDSGHSIICDSNGKIVLISDGYNLFDSTLNYIDGGEKLEFDSVYNYTQGTSCPFEQNSILLPMDSGIYYMVNGGQSDSAMLIRLTTYVPLDYMLYHKIDMKQNNGAGKVVQRMQVLDAGRFSYFGLTACRHANGYDWWVIKLGADSMTYTTYLFTQNSVTNMGEQKFVTKIELRTGGFAAEGQLMFNQEGTKLLTISNFYNAVSIMDFDRCTGKLSNYKYHYGQIDTADADYRMCGGCFSPNGRFVYISKAKHVLQYDLQAPDSLSAWYQVCRLDTTLAAFQSYSNIYLGPNGKVYLGSLGGINKQMSVIDSPNNKGIACQFCPRCLRFDSIMPSGGSILSPPNMPNYNLGALPAPCPVLAVPELGVLGDKIEVYPNPASQTLHIQYTLQGKASLTLYDMLGNALYSKALDPNYHNETIDISQLATGIYSVQIRTASQVLSRKVVKE